MKVGILGSGEVAKTLGAGFLKHGHDVMLGTRDNGKLADWAAQNPGGAKKRVGRWVAARAAALAGLGGSGSRTLPAPAASGKIRALPSPKAKNSLGTE